VSTTQLDPRFTFDNFVIGAGNRLAAAAARRVAESPGTTYNPLFIYSASGLGKTHLVTAIGHHTRRLQPGAQLAYATLEAFMDDVMRAIEAGERESFRSRLGSMGLLILDDVQFLAGRHRTQEELLRVWDIVSANGGQVVLTSDRPPQEIDGLDERLLSRFSGGLIVDIGAPDYETRVAIARRKAEERGQKLQSGVAETLARIAFGNVRELQGALNRLLAVQELEGRPVEADEVARILGRVASAAQLDEFGSFLAEVTGTLEEVVTELPGEVKIGRAIERWRGEGYRTRRLESALTTPDALAAVDDLIGEYEAAIGRLREIASEIAALDPTAPELERREVLNDPDRVQEAESLLESVRTRCRPLPPPPAEHTFERLQLAADLFEYRIALAVAEEPGSQYNPLFIHGPAGSGKTALLAAIGNRSLELGRASEVAFVEGEAFAAELIEALEHNRVESWRARYRRAELFLLDDIDVLGETERAQEELFHLFDALQRAGAQLVFTASAAPEALTGFAERLRTRLESGLVISLEEETSSAAPSTAPAAAAAATSGDEVAAGSVVVPPGVDLAESGRSSRPDPWFQDPEKVILVWPYLDDLIVEEWE